MKCIICQHEMKITHKQGIEIDLCPYCGGVWLDPGEFNRLSGMDPSEYRQIECSHCGATMVTRTLHGIEIDLCPECGGVWLDNGELEKIVELNLFSNRFQMFHETVALNRDLERATNLQRIREQSQPMFINDIFVVYKDGCLIAHKTRRLKPDMDGEILSAMFLAIQDFITDSFTDAPEYSLKSLIFGNSQILVEQGENIFIAAVVGGNVQSDFSDKMRSTIQKIETDFSAVLTKWDHEYTQLRDVQFIVEDYLLH